MTPSKTALTRERIHEVVWDLAARLAGKEGAQITAECRLVHDLAADSLALIEFGMELEEELEFTSPEGLIEDPNLTLGQIEQALCDRLLKA